MSSIEYKPEWLEVPKIPEGMFEGVEKLKQDLLMHCWIRMVQLDEQRHAMEYPCAVDDITFDTTGLTE